MGLFGGLSNIGNVFKNKWKSVLIGAGSGGMLPGFAEAMMTDKGKNLSQEIHKGLGNLLTGGYISQKKATEQAKEASSDAKKELARQAAAAKAEAERLANIEEERKRKMARVSDPQTLLGGYIGIPGGASTMKPTLG